MNVSDSVISSVGITSVLDKANNPTTLDPASVYNWTMSDATFGSITPGSGGLTCSFTPSGKLGSFLLNCSIPAVNAQPGITGGITIVVQTSAAYSIVIT